MEYKRLSTSPLIDKCLERDPLAWAEFVGRFSKIMEFSIRKVLKEYSSPASYENAKDILQDLLMSFWNGDKLSGIQKRENINYWLVVTARNATLNYLRSRRKETLVSDELYFDKLPAKNDSCNIEKLKNMDKEIDKFFSSLSVRETLVFKLYFEKKLILKDISKIMGVPIGTVSSVVTRMRKKIKCRKI